MSKNSTSVPVEEQSKKMNINTLAALVEEGLDTMNIVQESESILVIGKTGVGKSTLINGLIGNRLIAKEKGLQIKEEEKKEEEKSSGYDSGEDRDGNTPPIKEYYIDVDESGKNYATIGHSTKSQTTIPGIFFDQERDVTYYDCPGFGDTKSIEQDIANSVFIKHILDNSQKLKIVFVLDYASIEISRGGELINILKMIANFDFKEIKDSFSIILTKAPIGYSRDILSLKKKLQL